MNAPRVAMLWLLALAIGSAVGCGGGSTATETPRPTQTSSGAKPSGSGTLIISKPTGLDQYDLGSGTEKPLIPATNANTFLLDPAVSKDGRQLAYVVQPPPKISASKYDYGSDLWVAGGDGGNPHLVLEHGLPNQLIRYPQWQDAGHVLAIVQEIDSAGGKTNVEYWLERIDIANGTRTQVLKDVLAYRLSPDGGTLIYAKLALRTGETMDSAFINGTGDKTVVGIDQNLSPFTSPRFSPDGTSIAFASADQAGARAHVEYVTTHVGDSAFVASATDGLPEDIWTIPAAGGSPVRIADLKEDLPALTWGGDGKHIYVGRQHWPL